MRHEAVHGAPRAPKWVLTRALCVTVGLLRRYPCLPFAKRSGILGGDKVHQRSPEALVPKQGSLAYALTTAALSDMIFQQTNCLPTPQLRPLPIVPADTRFSTPSPPICCQFNYFICIWQLAPWRGQKIAHYFFRAWRWPRFCVASKYGCEKGAAPLRCVVNIYWQHHSWQAANRCRCEPFFACDCHSCALCFALKCALSQTARTMVWIYPRTQACREI